MQYLSVEKLTYSGGCPTWLKKKQIFLKNSVSKWDITALTHALLSTGYLEGLFELDGSKKKEDGVNEQVSSREGDIRTCRESIQHFRIEKLHSEKPFITDMELEELMPALERMIRTIKLDIDRILLPPHNLALESLTEMTTSSRLYDEYCRLRDSAHGAAVKSSKYFSNWSMGDDCFPLGLCDKDQLAELDSLVKAQNGTV